MNKHLGESHFSDQDQIYIKKYLESHTDNRMAWYLLGKKYEQAGELGKANYCFNQAGDVYKAFENEPLPKEALAEKHLQQQEEKARLLQGKKRRRTLMRLLLLAFCLLLLITFKGEGGDETVIKAGEEGLQSSSAEHVNPSQSLPQEDYSSIYLSGNGEDELADSLLSAVKQTTSTQTTSYVVSQSVLEDWRLWTLHPSAMYAVYPSSKGGEADVTALQAEDCECSVEQGQANRLSHQWALDEQRRLQARSMIAAAVGMGHTPPDDISELAGQYPANYISGLDKDLIPYYKEALDSWKEAGSPEDTQVVSKALFGAVNPNSSPFPEAMRIVVDKKTHQLAVVSGDQIIRQYSVGLGGERTPEGKFKITEKVVNPNGRSDGTFGSRGMTLSHTLYAIHGTNEPDSIGKDESLGCIRMKKEDVEELFDLVPMGTEVWITSGELPGAGSDAGQDKPYRVPLTSGQDNPNKIYKWLN